MTDDLMKRLLGYEAYSHIKYQSGEGTKAPRFVYVDADYEVGDGNCGLHSSAKQTNEPAIPYARVDALLAQAARIERLEAALTPFAFLDEDTTQEAWEIRYRDRFQDWIDFGDIELARAAMKESQS